MKTFRFSFVWCVLILSWLTCERLAQASEAVNPYGTCAHLADPGENDCIPANIDQMRAIGLGWSRSDIRWASVEPKPGEWHFERADRMIQAARERNLNVLVILGYQNAHCQPVWEHLDEWKNYVATVVKRYGSHVKCWEIWNEENISFGWGHDGNAAEYLPVLRTAWETIKELDPEATVLFGGVSGMGQAFVEDCLKLGAADCFDGMAVHPYRGSLTHENRIEAFRQDLRRMRELLNRYGGSSKSLWVTEMGWATPSAVGRSTRAVMKAAFARIFAEQGGIPKELALVRDERFADSVTMADGDWELVVPAEIPTRFLNLDEIQKLDVAQTPAICFPPGLDFPLGWYEAVRDYVKRGGTVLFMRDLPIYEGKETASDGAVKPKSYSREFIHGLRVNWLAWWTCDVPKTSRLAAAEGMESFFPFLVPTPERLKKAPQLFVGDRFFDGKFLREGDELIPILVGKTDSFCGTVAGIYRFRSDWKGNVVVCGLRTDCAFNTNRTSPGNQGNFLAQAILLALSEGVERFFSYEFQSPERSESDPESHFGITHQDLTFKTGALAYQTLIRLRPAGSREPEIVLKDGLCSVSWRRPDGKHCVAVWALEAPKKGACPLTGKLEEACDVLGNPIEKTAEFEFTSSITYFLMGG